MADIAEIGAEQLAVLLQVSRDFALQQLAESGGFLPFGTQARPDGETEFVRLADERTEGSLAEMLDLLQRALIERVEQGQIVAAATVVDILLTGSDYGSETEPGFDRAIRVHVEAPGFSRVVIAPYRAEAGATVGDQPYLVDGKMVAFAEAPVVFPG